MEGIRQYVISVVAAAMLCGILAGLFENGTAKQLVKMICGLFLAFTVMSPIGKLDFDNLLDLDLLYSEDAAQAAALGEDLARESMADIIKAETEAYILDKAAAMNAELTVEVTLTGEDPPIPESVRLDGEISPYARQKLSGILQDELGISKENQLWTG